MPVGVAADHGGFGLKEELVAELRAAAHEVVDFGAISLNPDDDYPDFVIPLARAVAAGQVERSVAICGSGVGASVCANKIPGVCAALIHDHFSARQGVEDDHMNILCLGGRTGGTGGGVGPCPDLPRRRVQSRRTTSAPPEEGGFSGSSTKANEGIGDNHERCIGSIVDQYDPYPLDRRRSAGEVRTSRYADGTGSARLHDLEPRHALRPARPGLAEPGSVSCSRTAMPRCCSGPCSHLTGTEAVNADYERFGHPAVSLDDIRRFRQLDSKAPGHPEYHWVSGVETTTGPLGQGVATSVGHGHR